jgi:hypothetical protein
MAKTKTKTKTKTILCYLAIARVKAPAGQWREIDFRSGLCYALPVHTVPALLGVGFKIARKV